MQSARKQEPEHCNMSNPKPSSEPPKVENGNTGYGLLKRGMPHPGMQKVTFCIAICHLSQHKRRLITMKEAAV